MQCRRILHIPCSKERKRLLDPSKSRFLQHNAARLGARVSPHQSMVLAPFRFNPSSVASLVSLDASSILSLWCTYSHCCSLDWLRKGRVLNTVSIVGSMVFYESKGNPIVVLCCDRLLLLLSLSLVSSRIASSAFFGRLP